MCETQTCWKAGDLMHKAECLLIAHVHNSNNNSNNYNNTSHKISEEKKDCWSSLQGIFDSPNVLGVECLVVTFQQSAFWGPCFLLRSCVMTLLWLDPGVWGADKRAEGQRGSRTKNPVNDHLTKLGSRTYSSLITV